MPNDEVDQLPRKKQLQAVHKSRMDTREFTFGAMHGFPLVTREIVPKNCFGRKGF